MKKKRKRKETASVHTTTRGFTVSSFSSGRQIETREKRKEKKEGKKRGGGGEKRRTYVGRLRV